MSAEITLSSLFDFNKPFKKRKEPMVTFKKQPFCLAAEENVNLYGSYLFLLPLVNDPGQASTLENQGFPRNKCALHAL